MTARTSPRPGGSGAEASELSIGFLRYRADRRHSLPIESETMMDFSHITVDAVRTYWDRRPCNIRHSPRPVGTREYFDEVEARKYFVEPHIPQFAQFERWNGKKVLELGCGIGTDTVNFARHGAMVTAVDLSPQSLELAQRRVEVYGLQDQVRFYSGSAEELSSFVPVEAYD